MSPHRPGSLSSELFHDYFRLMGSKLQGCPVVPGVPGPGVCPAHSAAARWLLLEVDRWVCWGGYALPPDINAITMAWAPE